MPVFETGNKQYRTRAIVRGLPFYRQFCFTDKPFVFERKRTVIGAVVVGIGKNIVFCIFARKKEINLRLVAARVYSVSCGGILHGKTGESRKRIRSYLNLMLGAVVSERRSAVIPLQARQVVSGRIDIEINVV